MDRHLANLKKERDFTTLYKTRVFKLNVVPIVTNLFCSACFLAFFGVEFGV